MRFYYVDPGDPNAISGPYEEGKLVTLPDGRGPLQLYGADPPADIYLAAEDNEQCVPSNYYTRPVTKTLIGASRDPASFVQEAHSCVQIPIAELRDIKETERALYTDEVFYSAFVHEQGPLKFWATSSAISLTSRNNYCSYLTTRSNDLLWAAVQAGIDDGGGINNRLQAFYLALEVAHETPADTYWARDIRVFLYAYDTLESVQDSANQNQWSDLMESQGTFTHQVRAADQRVRDAIAVAYGDGSESNWAAVAAVNVRDPSFNYPEHNVGPFIGNGTVTVQELLQRHRETT